MDTPRRIAVTGANGFIGRALAHHLGTLGYEVVPLSRDKGVQYADICGLARKIAGAHSIIHLAAHAHQRGKHIDYSINERITRAICTAANRAKISHLIYVSSIGVNGNQTHGVSFTEADSPQPQEPYATSKLNCENIIINSGVAYTLLRPPMVYGPHAPGNFGKLLKLVNFRCPLPLKGIKNQRSFIGLDNLLSVISLCLTHPAAIGEIFLVADAQAVTTQELVEILARGLNQRAYLFPVPAFIPKLAANFGVPHIVNSLYGDLVVDTSKVKHILNWYPLISALAGIEDAARKSIK